MTTGTTQLADVIVPEIFSPYVIEETVARCAIVKSGAMMQNDYLQLMMNGGGSFITMPSFRNLDNDEENSSTDDPNVMSIPAKIQSSEQVAVRLSRNNNWSSMDLVAELAGADPVNAIVNKVADYWARRLQMATLSVIQGVFASNSAGANDMTLDISAATTPAFSAESFIDACATMGDNMDKLKLVCVHSLVYAKMQKLNLITTIPNSINPAAVPEVGATLDNYPTYLNKIVVVDDDITTVSSGVYQTLIFGQGALSFASGQPKIPTEIERVPSAGTGGGQEKLHNRVAWVIHPNGWKYVGAALNPKNSDLANAANWVQAYADRKQIAMARLISKLA